MNATTVEAPAKPAVPERLDTYKTWLEAQNIPIVRGFYIGDINEVELGPWDLKGAPAAFVQLEGTGGTNDAYILELPPGGKTKPLRHMSELRFNSFRHRR